MKKALFVDAVGMLDTDLIEAYVLQDQSLRSRHTNRKRRLFALLAAAAAMLLCVALLVTSLPLIYVFNAEKINAAVSETVENVLFPLDSENGEIDREDIAFNWVEMPIAGELFQALGAGTDDSIIDKLQSAQDDTLVGQSMQNLGNFLSRMYAYYLKYRDDDGTVDQETTETETETETETKPEETMQGDKTEIPYVVETGGVTYEIDLINNCWKVAKIDGVRELMESNGVLRIAEQLYDLPVTKIESYAADGNTLIKELILPNSMTTIGVSAFEECKNLKKITWGEGIARIEMLAFARCGITALELPQSVKSVGDHAFTGCTSLKTVKLPTSMKTVQENCFSGCTALEHVIIPEGYTTLYDGAFAGCTALKSIELPESIRVLDVSVFANSGLEYAAIPEGIETVERTVFKGCKSLRSVYLPDAMYEIPEGLFVGCSALTEIRFPSACTAIRAEAFAQCTALREMDMPDTIVIIEKRAFYGCIKLEQVKFSAKLVRIETEAFMSCLALQSVILPEGFVDLGGAAFEGCSELIELSLPSTLQNLRSHAFKGCSSLLGVQIPETLSYVEENVFENCYSLYSVYLPAFSSEKARTDGMFKDCYNLISVTFGEGFDSADMGKNMFENTALIRITVPENVTVINEFAFTKCKDLRTVVLHANVQQISRGAFDGCTSLAKIEYPGTIAEFESGVTIDTDAIPSGVRIICSDGELIVTK